MVVIHCAYTEAINPSGASPTLTRDQIWKGLQRKIRRAQDFVPGMTGTDVIEEKENEVTRVAHFEGRPVKEVCKSYYPTKVDFWQTNGALITNTISDGSSLDGVDLNMTYTFEWKYPDVMEGSEEHRKKIGELIETAKMAVHSSIVSMRKIATTGELD